MKRKSYQQGGASSGCYTKEKVMQKTKHKFVWIADDVKIGEGTRIQPFTFIPSGVTIGKNVFIGPHVCFTNDPRMTCQGPEFWACTHVKDGVKIGAGACIMAGVTIGEKAVIGMGAVILTDVPAGETWVGNPARKLK